MRIIFLIILLTLSIQSIGQKTNSNRNAPPPPPIEPDTIIHRHNIDETPFFDYWEDYLNYSQDKPCVNKKMYEKYILVDSFPHIDKIQRTITSYPPPCYKIVDSTSVQNGIYRNYFFLGMLLEKKLSCKEDGSTYETRVYSRTVSVEINNNSIEEAFELLKKHDKNPFNRKELDALWDTAKVYFNLKDFKKSNSIFAFLATIDERYLEAGLNNIGLSFYHLEEYTAALHYFEKVVRLYPKGYLGYLNLGAAMTKIPVDMGDLNQSFIYFKRAYELAPHNPNVIFNYANSMQSFSDVSEKYRKLKDSLIEKATFLDPSNPSFKYSFATTLHQKAMEKGYSINEGELKQAMDLYKEGVDMFPEFPDNYLGIAKLYSYLRKQNQEPLSKIFNDSACIFLEKYKKLIQNSLDKDKESLCIQFLKNESKYIDNYKTLIPNGWETMSMAKGDLNNDSIDDIVIIARETNPDKIKNIVRYNTPNHESGIKNYNNCILYVLLANPKHDNYEIKVENNEIIETNYGYYTQEYEVKYKNGAFSLTRNENPQDDKKTKIFRLKNENFILIGVEETRFKDKLGNINSKFKDDTRYWPIDKFNISYNYNTQTLLLSKVNLSNNSKVSKSIPFVIDEIILNEKFGEKFNIWRKITEEIKNFR